MLQVKHEDTFSVAFKKAYSNNTHRAYRCKLTRRYYVNGILIPFVTRAMGAVEVINISSAKNAEKRKILIDGFLCDIENSYKTEMDYAEQHSNKDAA